MDRLFPLAALATLLAGCDRAPCSPGEEDPTLQIGTGERSYEPLDHDEPTMEIVHGSQGGYHVFIGFEATYLEGSDLLLGSLTGTVGGEVLGESQPWLQMRCNPRTKTLQSWGTLLIWDAVPEELHGQTALIEATVRDVEENVVSDEVTVLLWDPGLAP